MTKSLYKLQLTNGFSVDFTQIARMLDFSIQHQDEGRIPVEVYTTGIGLSDRRVKNLGSIAGALMLLRSMVLTPTKLGKVIHRYDPYFDDLGTLWLLHYAVSSEKRYVVWNRLVNQVIPENNRFSTAIARPYYDDLAQFYSEGSINQHLRKEIGRVWDAYTEQSFAHLDYLWAESDQIYILGDCVPVPPSIFLAAVLLYRERYTPRAATLDVPILASAPNSPGRAFALTQRQSRDLLEQVKGRGSVYVESRADLDQVRFRSDLGFLDVMRQYYEGR